MARGVNRVIIVGFLGADPETRYTTNGGAITTIKVATSEQWKDKQTGENQERTEWHRIKFFGRLAEIAGEYLKKGRQVYIEGSLRTDKYTDKEGVERYTTDIIANGMQMLGGNPDGERTGRTERTERPSRGARAPTNDDPFGDKEKGQGAYHSPATPAGSAEDDEIPF